MLIVVMEQLIAKTASGCWPIKTNSFYMNTNTGGLDLANKRWRWDSFCSRNLVREAATSATSIQRHVLALLKAVLRIIQYISQ